MAAKWTYTANTPFPTITGDAYAAGGSDVPSAVSGGPIDFDIKFTFEGEADPSAPPPAPGDPPATVDTAPILSVTLNGSLGVEGLKATPKGKDTINIKGTPTNVFTDEIFRFLFADKSERNLPSTNTEDWLTIVKWAAPSLKEKHVSYKFTVKYDANPAAVVPIVAGQVDVEIGEYIYWMFEPSLAAFQALVKKGKV